MRLTFLATLLFFFIVVFGQHNNNTPKVRKSSNKQQIDSALVLKFLKTAVSLELNDPAKSLEFAERAKNMAQSIRYDSAEVKALELMGSNYSRLMRLNEAIETGEKVIETATRYGFELDIAFGREIIAVAYAQGGDFDRSSKLYFENLKFYEKLKEKRLLGRTLGNIGADFIEQRNYKKAVEYTNKALEIGLQT
jgi:tetratricopeptide (TPR) repeat protein